MTTHIRPDVLFIGYAKAASTFVGRFLESHPEVTVDQYKLADLLHSTGDSITLVDKSDRDKIHVSKDENVAESVCLNGQPTIWRANMYIPGAWDRMKDSVIVDPEVAASRLYNVHPYAKVLLLIREQSDWLQSVYKYVMSELPWNKRSFADYCTTPSGVVMLEVGHFDRTIGAYVDVFGSNRICVLRFEDIATAPKRFMAELCSFIGISEREIPLERANETHAQIARIQRFLPVIESLPKSVKNTLRARVRWVPGGRGNILSSRDIRILRCMYAASNERAHKLISQLPKHQ